MLVALPCTTADLMSWIVRTTTFTTTIMRMVTIPFRQTIMNMMPKRRMRTLTKEILNLSLRSLTLRGSSVLLDETTCFKVWVTTVLRTPKLACVVALASCLVSTSAFISWKGGNIPSNKRFFFSVIKIILLIPRG